MGDHNEFPRTRDQHNRVMEQQLRWKHLLCSNSRMALGLQREREREWEREVVGEQCHRRMRRRLRGIIRYRRGIKGEGKGVATGVAGYSKMDEGWRMYEIEDE